MSNLAKIGLFISEELVPYIKADRKKPFLTQAAEMIKLYERYQSLPYQYIKSRLYSTNAPVDIENYMPPKLITNLQNSLNDKRKLKYAYDKHVFRVYMESKGLPVVRELFRILPSGVILDSDGIEIARSVAEQLLAKHGKNVFVKPTTGAFGGGAFIHDITKPIDCLFTDTADILVQPVITQHKVINDLHPGSLNTIRIDTLLYDNQCINNAAVLKIGVDGMIVDNLRAGGLVVGIDIKTGRLFPTAMQRSKFTWVKCKYHPETHIAFSSITIPFWSDVIDLTREAALALPWLRTLGWDVAITQTGPILIETNINWGANLMQNGWGGMGATRIGKLAQELR
jgi:hypothetical protein